MSLTLSNFPTTLTRMMNQIRKPSIYYFIITYVGNTIFFNARKKYIFK